MSELTLAELRDAVGGDGVGVRCRVDLEPLGGEGDKVFPPTYAVDRAPTKYATETRRIGGEDRLTVLLDSVASQANRQELALLEAVRAGELDLPLVSVDFRHHEKIADLDVLSVLEVPHRIYDAILRDSLLDGTMFRLSDVGRAITDASPRNAAALFHASPTTLLFGAWDSTGPKGGRGHKFERAITSEVVAIGVTAEPAVKPSSRLDPLAVERDAATIYKSDDDLGWTLDPEEAVKDNGKPVAVKGGGEGAAGRPSHINHGNIAPSIDASAGGVTADRILGISTLSFIGLRRLRFPVDHQGTAVPEDEQRDAGTAARTALAALGLAAITLAFEEGFDLRSRCVLVPTEPLTFELMRRGGGSEEFTLGRDKALALVGETAAVAADKGLPWRFDELLLDPAPRLVDLIIRSRELTESKATGEDG